MTAPLPQLSEQDVQAALRLVAESWDRQQYRLQQYLDRNYCLLQGIPTAMEISEEEFERPESVSTLGKVLEKVRADTTPTVEKEIDFLNLPGLSISGDDDDLRSVTRQQALEQAQPGQHRGPDPSLTTDEREVLMSHDRFFLERDQYGNELQRSESPGPFADPVSPMECDPADGLEMGLGIREGPRTPTQQTFT